MGCEICGWLSALCAMLAFGSFGVPIKSKRAVSVNIDPLVFQSYKSTMCFLTCWLVLLFGVPFTFTPWGIVSGLFWVPGGVATVYGIKTAGLAISIGGGSSFIVLVSFIWGIFVFQEEVRSKTIASFAIVLMMAGLYGMAYFSSPEAAAAATHAIVDEQEDDDEETEDSPSTATSISCDPAATNQLLSQKMEREETMTTERTVRTLYSDLSSNQEVTTTLDGSSSPPVDLIPNDIVDPEPEEGRSEDDDDDGDSDSSSLYSDEEETMTDRGQQRTRRRRMDITSHPPLPHTKYIRVCGIRMKERTAGVLAPMIFTGCWGGSILVPMKFCDTPGVEFLISFGIGAMSVTVGLWVIRILYNAHVYYQGSIPQAIATLPSFHLPIMWLPGGLSGTLWSIGNFFSILSVNILGEGVGYPVIQTSILVSGIWGICFFREVQGTKRILQWLCSSLFTIAGILLLSYEHVRQET